MEYEYRALASGTLVEVDEGGKAAFMLCDWWIEVPTNHPEPDSREDMYRIEECGSRLKARNGKDIDGGYECGAGHIRRPMEEEFALFGPAWQDEQRERMEGRW